MTRSQVHKSGPNPYKGERIATLSTVKWLMGVRVGQEE